MACHALLRLESHWRHHARDGPDQKLRRISRQRFLPVPLKPVVGVSPNAAALFLAFPLDGLAAIGTLLDKSLTLVKAQLVERDVRFVQVYSGGRHGDETWDAHDNVDSNHELHCAETDLPIAGLLKDLKNRSLLEDTLVVWAGEFGRTPTSQNTVGRDHSPRGFSTWMAGGVKGGQVIGKTDDFGYKAVENPVHVHDLHATILHLMGLDHTLLTYFNGGRDMRLTDVHGRVVQQLLA